MAGQAFPDPTPTWMRPSVVTGRTQGEASPYEPHVWKAIRALAGLIGADDPESQVMGLATTNVPAKNAIAEAVSRLSGKGPIKAYHGSPHDFDKFDLSKIGTGEGAQAYGHGLYFAENEATAQAYRDMLRDKFSGAAPTNWDDPIHVGIRAAELAGGREEGISRLAQTVTARTADPKNKAIAEQAIAFLRSGEPFEKYTGGPSGRMYEVAIKADPDTLLDWDAPLSQQPQAFQKLARRDLLQGEYGRFSDYRLGHDPSGRALYGEMEERLEQLWKRGIERPPVGKEGVSDRLKQAGIPGLKYLDQGSRTAGEGTRNYVMFDDSLIDILRKWGLLPAAVAAPELMGQDAP